MEKRILKAYERYDYNGRVVPGSLVLRYKKPKNGKWKELTGYECCNDITTTTTIPPAFRMFATTTSPSQTFQFSIGSLGGVLPLNIDWGDGNSETVSTPTYSSSDLAHTYVSPGSYVVTLTSTSPQYFGVLNSFTSILKNITGWDQFPNMTGLYISNGGFTSVDFGTLNFLSSVTLIDMPSLTSFTFTSLPALSFLHLYGTNISGNLFSGKSLPLLSELNAAYTDITNIDLSGLPDLYILRLMGCAITNSTDIDNIFIGILANDRTGGVIDVSGGTNAAPTAASAAARATLTNFDYDYYLAYN